MAPHGHRCTDTCSTYVHVGNQFQLSGPRSIRRSTSRGGRSLSWNAFLRLHSCRLADRDRSGFHHSDHVARLAYRKYIAYSKLRHANLTSASEASSFSWDLVQLVVMGSIHITLHVYILTYVHVQYFIRDEFASPRMVSLGRPVENVLSQVHRAPGILRKNICIYPILRVVMINEWPAQVNQIIF